MTAIYETAYPRIKSRLSEKELVEIYTPTPEELLFAEKYAKENSSKLGLLIMLKAFQRLGYFLPLHDIPKSIISHIANCAGFDISQEVYSYDDSSSRYRHLSLIRDFVGVTASGEESRKIMYTAIEEATKTKDEIADIIQN